MQNILHREQIIILSAQYSYRVGTRFNRCASRGKKDNNLCAHFTVFCAQVVLVQMIVYALKKITWWDLKAFVDIFQCDYEKMKQKKKKHEWTCKIAD